MPGRYSFIDKGLGTKYHSIYMLGNFNSPDIKTFRGSDGTEGWIDHVPTEEELAADKSKQVEANKSMKNQINAREEELGIKQPEDKELIASLMADFDMVEPEPPEVGEPDTGKVVTDLRELFKN